MMKKNYFGFTLIELLVVISVIAVLSTLTVVYLETARMTARDTRRISDVKQIQLALKMYYNDTGMYPTYVTINNSIANGGTNYLLRVPSNPTPRNDNGCDDQEYQYTQLENGQGYNLTFCLGDRTDDLDGGSHSGTHNGILNCPTGYLAVPGSSTYNTNDFCVMKWEAKCADDTDLTTGLPVPATGSQTYDNENFPCTIDLERTPVSVSSGYPIGSVDQKHAVSLCESIEAHLMTNAEWMTIAHNLENVASNWFDPNNPEVHTIGTGYVYEGNFGSTGNLALDGTDEFACRDEACKRTLSLSTGEKIWDLSANVAELLANTCEPGGPGEDLYEPSSGSYFEWDSERLADYELGASGPSINPNTAKPYNSEQKIGQYYGCANSGNIFIRGGRADESTEAGIFSLSLEHGPDRINPLYGFRCVK